MRWISLAVLLALVLAVAAAADGESPVLGRRGLFPSSAGWGTIAPPKIDNGGDPTGIAFKLRWSSWGAPTAEAHGLAWIVRPGNALHFYAKPGSIELRAYRLGTCYAGGPWAYTRLRARTVVRPGGRYGPWHEWGPTPTICKGFTS